MIPAVDHFGASDLARLGPAIDHVVAALDLLGLDRVWGGGDAA